ncbi:DJ-1/PfpI family protein [Salicibibacter cibarius]|uniref:DJ-1/PfpI family protein n=1 Tax=Salicibibacter cibarius TaxID=2743000 RepID=A0A7T6Z627_9BACI|nr:DJ-1/PfpI family protein [Salicibibacter cibarius]QQK77051.1 DJ-1/PfpI family protein [Salicibibacter cibarius]
MTIRKVGIFLYDYVDSLDFVGLAEVLSFTSYNKGDQVEIFTITEFGQRIRTHSGVKIMPDFSIVNAPEIDILIIPRGPLKAVQSVAKNQKVKDWIIKHKNSDYICSVCTGTYILGATGLLDGKKATTHHLAVKDLQAKYPHIQVLSVSKVVHTHNLISSAGVSSGINMAMYLVEQIFGKPTAERTAHTLLDWKKTLFLPM